MYENLANWENDPFWGGFANFVETNFPQSIEEIVEELQSANRFQKGNESIVQVLQNRGDMGEAVLRIIKLYLNQAAGTIDINAPNSAGHLQTFSEAVTPLLRKKYYR